MEDFSVKKISVLWSLKTRIKKIFNWAIFYRTIDRKMTFDFVKQQILTFRGARFVFNILKKKKNLHKGSKCLLILEKIIFTEIFVKKIKKNENRRFIETSLNYREIPSLIFRVI